MKYNNGNEKSLDKEYVVIVELPKEVARLNKAIQELSKLGEQNYRAVHGEGEKVKVETAYVVIKEFVEALNEVFEDGNTTKELFMEIVKEMWLWLGPFR